MNKQRHLQRKGIAGVSLCGCGSRWPRGKCPRCPSMPSVAPERTARYADELATVREVTGYGDRACPVCRYLVCTPACNDGTVGEIFEALKDAREKASARAAVPAQPPAAEPVPSGWVDKNDPDIGWGQFTRSDRRASVWRSCFSRRWCAGTPTAHGSYSWDARANGGTDWTAQPKHESARAAMLWADAELAKLDAAKAPAPFTVGQRMRCVRGAGDLIVAGTEYVVSEYDARSNNGNGGLSVVGGGTLWRLDRFLPADALPPGYTWDPSAYEHGGVLTTPGGERLYVADRERAVADAWGRG